MASGEGMKLGLGALFQDEMRGDGRAAHDDFFMSPEEVAALPVAPKAGPGRPKGAKNRKHEAIRARYLGRWTHPLDVLGAIQSMPIAELAKDLDCKKAEAMQIVIRAASEALPYIESKQPIRVDHSGEGLPIMILGRIESGSGEVRVIGREMPELVPLLDDDAIREAEKQALDFVREIAEDAEP